MYAAVDLGFQQFSPARSAGMTAKPSASLKSMREPIRLAAGLDANGDLTEAAMQARAGLPAQLPRRAGRLPLDAVRVVATSAMRVARNGAAFLPAAEQAIGYPIEIISGEEEGRLIYMGVASSLAAPERAAPGDRHRRRLDRTDTRARARYRAGRVVQRRHRQAKPVVLRGRAHRRGLVRARRSCRRAATSRTPRRLTIRSNWQPGLRLVGHRPHARRRHRRATSWATAG